MDDQCGLAQVMSILSENQLLVYSEVVVPYQHRMTLLRPSLNLPDDLKVIPTSSHNRGCRLDRASDLFGLLHGVEISPNGNSPPMITSPPLAFPVWLFLS